MKLIQEIDPILHSQTDPFDFNGDIDPTIVISEMFEIMTSNNGIGLSSPQVGLSLRLFVMMEENTYRRMACINPKITDYKSEIITDEEGCLSYPNLILKIDRVNIIEVEYYDQFGKKHTEILDGRTSRCFQHELDHLNGVTFDQKVSKLVLNMAKRRQRKLQRKGGK